LLRFHFLLKQVRGFFLQADVHGPVADQVAVATGAAKRLEENVLLATRPSARVRGPKILQSILGGSQLCRSQVNGKKWQHEMKAVGVAARQDEVVAVAQGRKIEFARFSHLPDSFEGLRD
jgi:hypothetical protein